MNPAPFVSPALHRQAPLPRALLLAVLSALRVAGLHAQLQLAEALVAWAERCLGIAVDYRTLMGFNGL